MTENDHKREGYLSSSGVPECGSWTEVLKSREDSALEHSIDDSLRLKKHKSRKDGVGDFLFASIGSCDRMMGQVPKIDGRRCGLVLSAIHKLGRVSCLGWRRGSHM